MEDLTLPLIFNDHGDLDLYNSVEELIGVLEVVDENDEYECFDGAGTILSLFVQTTEEKLDRAGRDASSGTVGVRFARPRRSEPERLAELITDFLTATGQTTQDASKSREDLSLLLKRLPNRLGRDRP